MPNLCLLCADFVPILCRFCVAFVSILWWAFCMDLRIFCFWVEKLGRLSQFIPLHLTLTVSMRFYDCLATKSSSFGTVSIYRWWQKCTVLQNTMVNVELVEILNMIHFCSNYARLPGVPGQFSLYEIDCHAGTYSTYRYDYCLYQVVQYACCVPYFIPVLYFVPEIL